MRGAEKSAMKIRGKAIFSGLCFFLAAVIIWTAWGNRALELNEYKITSGELPEGFHGYRIAHVSDLHNAEFGEKNEKLLDMLRDADPDLIAITGDMIDSRNTEVDVALQFAENAMKIAPCYYVPGNHEARVTEYDILREGLQQLGVQVLEEERILLEKDGEAISLLGVRDPSFQTNYLNGEEESIMNSWLSGLRTETDSYTILLSHRPELFSVYAEQEMNFVLSGHAHGGQFRLPLVGGLVAPNQGFFPEYDSGVYTEHGTSMVVSHGIGNSLFPFRFNNRPEVILIELRAEK